MIKKAKHGANFNVLNEGIKVLLSRRARGSSAELSFSELTNRQFRAISHKRHINAPELEHLIKIETVFLILRDEHHIL